MCWFCLQSKSSASASICELYRTAANSTLRLFRISALVYSSSVSVHCTSTRHRRFCSHPQLQQQSAPLSSKRSLSESVRWRGVAMVPPHRGEELLSIASVQLSWILEASPMCIFPYLLTWILALILFTPLSILCASSDPIPDLTKFVMMVS